MERLINSLPSQRGGRAMQFLNDPWSTRKTLLEWQQTGRVGRQRNFEGMFQEECSSVFPHVRRKVGREGGG